MWQWQRHSGYVMEFPAIKNAEQLSDCGKAVFLSGKPVGEKSWHQKFQFGSYKGGWGFMLHPETG